MPATTKSPTRDWKAIRKAAGITALTIFALPFAAGVATMAHKDLEGYSLEGQASARLNEWKAAPLGTKIMTAPYTFGAAGAAKALNF